MVDRIRVAVVDGQPLFRKGLVDTISTAFDVVAVGETADDASRIVSEQKPDMLIFDINVPGDCIGVAAAALRKKSSMKLVILTASDHERDVADALRAGVHGYILKGVGGPQLLSAMCAIDRGEHYITPELATRLLMQTRGRSLVDDKASDLGLTVRDRTVLRHLARGLNNQQLASELGVNVRNIKYYLTVVFRKLRVQTRVEAVLQAQKMGLAVDEKVN